MVLDDAAVWQCILEACLLYMMLEKLGLI